MLRRFHLFRIPVIFLFMAMLTAGMVTLCVSPAHSYASSGSQPVLLSSVYVYDGVKTTYRDSDAQNIDQMFYSFALIQKGHVTVAHWTRIQKFQAFLQKHPNITPILSVGGWGADGFSQAAATPEGRAAFADDVVEILQQYGFRGVDIDWETPGSSAAGIKSSPDDKANFTLLLSELRAALDALETQDGVHRLLCVALSGCPELMASLESEKIGAIIDQVNLMTYDLQQPDAASHHSALYASHPGALSADACVRASIKAGIPRGKIMMGVAFYGHRWTVTGANPLYAPAKANGTLSYTAIVKLLRKTPSAAFYDEVAQAPYYANGKTFISYDDERSIEQKRLYAGQNGLLGLFAWAYGQDNTGTLLGAMRGTTP